MPKVSETFGGAYLKAELNGQPHAYTVDGYNIEKIYGEEKFVLYFVGEKRGLPLSATCARDIAKVLGDEMVDWSGGKIELYTEQKPILDRDTQAEKIITMFRARAPAKLPPSSRASPDDGIPF
jgi:hypothetical protein